MLAFVSEVFESDDFASDDFPGVAEEPLPVELLDEEPRLSLR